MTDEPAKEPSTPSAPSLLDKSEEDLYAMAMAEMQSETRRQGLWARVLSEAMGDEPKAEALYIRYRTDQLVEEQDAQRRAKIETERATPVIFDCPECGKKLKLTKGQLSDIETSKQPNWNRNCPGCKKTFDCRSAIPSTSYKLPAPPPVRKPTSTKPVPRSNGTKKRTGLATASLVCGICGLAYPVSILFLSSIAGIICGHIAISRIKDKPQEFDGPKRAKAGLIISYIALALGLVLGITMGFMRASINSSLHQMGY